MEVKQLSRHKRLFLGIIILLIVDIIWVGSSELSEYIFNDTGFDKPFFSTYLKTSMFALYLLGFIFWKPWRHQCLIQDNSLGLYQIVDTCPDDDSFSAQETSSLGEPMYEPLKIENCEKSSDAESDDSSVKSVRFSRMTEVRHMSESEAIEAMLSRLSFTASQRAEEFVKETANKFPIREVMKISLIFCIIWFLGNYSYQVALSKTEAGIVNVVASTCGLFTLIFSAAFPSGPSDKFSFSKLAAVLLMVVGTALISMEDLNLEKNYLPVGVIWSLIGAILYACYMVFIKRKVPEEDKMDFSMFFGFVGLFNMFILWPGFIICHVSGWEVFQLPNKQQLLYMAINGLIGTVISELLWLWGCFLTSSLLATLSLSLTIPLTMAFDIVLKGVHYSWEFYVGSLPIFASFIAVTLLTHFEDKDPLLDMFKALGKACLGRRKEYRLASLDINEEESLIVNASDDIFGEEVSVDEEINTSYQNHFNIL